MLRWLRRSDRLLALFALAIAAMVLVGTVDWWHADDDEGEQLAFHDHAAHRYVLQSTRPLSTRGSEHCYLCHWLRTLHNGLRTTGFHHISVSEDRQLPALTSARVSALVASLVPARAPPV